MVIVNADDFGLSTQVNKAILTCFREGVISSTTIMANMPAFEAASEAARQQGLLHCVGIHINITEGQPLTDMIRTLPRFCNPEGAFAFKRNRCFHLSYEERTALAAEISAQIERCRAHGLPLTHADSHHHSHTEWPIFAVISPLLRRYDIRSVRLTRNVGAKSSLSKAYKAAFNAWLRRQGLWTTRYFGNVDAFKTVRSSDKLSNEAWEIMTHPDYDEQGDLIDRPRPGCMVTEMRGLLSGVSLQSYGDIPDLRRKTP